MRRKKKSILKVNGYLLIALFCLVILFSGYDYFYQLSENRKKNNDIATISINYEIENNEVKYNELFIKIMSKFNIFFKETYRKLKENNGFYENDRKTIDTIFAILDNKDSNTNTIDIFNESECKSNDLYETKVYLANDKKEDFFVSNNMNNEIVSREGSIRDLNLNFDKINKEANIVVFHTHATETYIPEVKDAFHSKNEKYNVLGLGKKLSEKISDIGLDIKHIEVYNDLPSYSESYNNSYKVVSEEIVKDKKNILIDIHRDAGEKNSSYEKFLSGVTHTNINNKSVATFTMVIGGNNENLEQLKKTAKIVKNNSDEMYPGLCRDIVIKPNGYFNQELSDYALLIEIGSNLNNIEEAEYTCNLLAEVLCNSIIEIIN